MTATSLVRQLVPVVLALAAAGFLDRSMVSRRLLPPGFERSPLRRAGGFTVVALLFWIGVFFPLSQIGLKVETDMSQVGAPDLFLLHILMLLTLGTWFLLGFGGVRTAPPVPIVPAAPLAPGEGPAEAGGPAEREGGEVAFGIPVIPVVEPSLGRRFAQQMGLVAPSIPRELGLGIGLGFGAWAAVLAFMALVALGLYLAGSSAADTRELPAMIPWLAGQPLYLRIALCLSAGFVEELFFRGFLQPRIGIYASSALFVLAHLSYGQPLMLVGIAALSLIYGYLVRWRQSLWAAIAAHSLFDGIQLLILVPLVLKLVGEGGQGTATLTGFGLFGP
jgi:membrane protease YdiL (CAAX protease family)